MKIGFARSAPLRLLLAALLSMLITAACTSESQQVSGPSADAQAVGPEGVVLKEAPRAPDVRAKHLFYLHGRIIEEKGIRPEDPRYGVYEYEQILDTFRRLGFTVISEARPKDTDVKQYASRTAAQIQELLNAGVPPRLITVVGASKGSVIAMLTSTLLRNRDVNFVLMSNCNDWVARNFDIDLYGNVLSIYDVNDEFGQTCRKIFDGSTGLNRHEEVELKIGTGHAILYKPLKEWVDLVVEWAAEAAG
ncbi:MAG TPA: alpha/beta hydrolase [Blastocatellia bacterium]|nr:alpha/beta hydrolase [Blastocatellia bacterium]